MAAESASSWTVSGCKSVKVSSTIFGGRWTTRCKVPLGPLSHEAAIKTFGLLLARIHHLAKGRLFDIGFDRLVTVRAGKRLSEVACIVFWHLGRDHRNIP